MFPAKDDPSIAGPEYAKVRKYGGQQLLTGKQAEVYADHFIANHLLKAGGGKTYAELSSAAQANPSDTKLAATVQTMFRGETLRGLLLNAYAFGTIAHVMGIVAIVVFIAAALLLLLSVLGFVHSRKATPAETATLGAPAPL